MEINQQQPKDRNQLLPPFAQELLKRAAKTGRPYSKERTAAIDKAIQTIKRSCPRYFKE